MPLVLADRVRDTTTTTGTGTVTLSGTAPTGYQNFSVIGNGNTTYYTINAGSQWEVGIGTYSSTGPTLARTTVLESSNGGALVNFSAGVKDVFVTYPADEVVIQDGATIAAGTAVLGVANGGTGVTTSTGTGSVVLNTSPTLVTPTLGAASATSIANGLGSVGAPAYAFTGDLNTGMWSPAVDTLAFSTNGSERLRLDSSGNVGIGTTSPSARLDVSGSNSRSRLELNTTTATWVTTNPAANAYLGAAYDALSHRFLLSSSEAMRIDASGNVGIGTSAPTSRLTITGGITEIRDGNYLMLRPSGNGWDMRLQATGTQLDILSGGALGSPIMSLVNGGNVGIGVTPSTRLDVAGTSRYTFNVANSYTLLTSLNAAGSAFVDAYTNGLSHIWQTSGTERARIDSSGSMQLSVGGVSNTHQFLYNESGAEIQLSDATGNGPILIDNSGGLARFYKVGTGGMAVGTTGTGAFQFLTNNTERMRIDSSGNVGIGTTTPSAPLTVYSATGAFIDLFGDAGTTISAIRSSTDASGANMVLRKARGTTASRTAVASGDTMGTLFFSAFGGTSNRNIASIVGTVGTYTSDADISSNLIFNTTPTGSVSPTERMRIDSSGNVGIGLTGPQLPLSIGKGGGAPPATSGSTQSSGGIARLGSSGAATLDVGTLSSGSAWLQATNVTNLASNFDMLLNPNGGNVGIGTSSPGVRLDVAGGAIRVGNTHSMQFRNTAGTGVAVFTLQSDDNFVVYNAAGTPIQSFTQGANSFAVYGGNSNNRMLVDSGSNLIYWNVNGSERMRIDSSGNVGIGLSSPGARLDVKGLVRSSIGTGTGAGGAAYAFYQFGTSTTATENWHIGTEGDGSFRFYNQGFGAGLERMRISASGGVAIGGTGTDASLHIQQAYGGYDRLTQMSPNAASKNAFNIMAAKNSSSVDLWWSWGVRNDNVWAIEQGVNYNLNSSIGFFFDSGGQAYKSGGGSWAATSDARVKTNIAPISDAASRIMALKPSSFDYRVPEAHRGHTSDRGFIAQDFEKVYPRSVSESTMVADAEKALLGKSDKVKAISLNNDFFADLVALVQEQQMTINELRARVAQLEGK